MTYVWVGVFSFAGGVIVGLLCSIIEYEKEMKRRDDLEHGYDGGEPELFVVPYEDGDARGY